MLTLNLNNNTAPIRLPRRIGMISRHLLSSTKDKLARPLSPELKEPRFLSLFVIHLYFLWFPSYCSLCEVGLINIIAWYVYMYKCGDWVCMSSVPKATKFQTCLRKCWVFVFLLEFGTFCVVCSMVSRLHFLPMCYIYVRIGLISLILWNKCLFLWDVKVGLINLLKYWSEFAWRVHRPGFWGSSK